MKEGIVLLTGTGNGRGHGRRSESEDDLEPPVRLMHNLHRRTLPRTLAWDYRVEGAGFLVALMQYGEGGANRVAIGDRRIARGELLHLLPTLQRGRVGSGIEIVAARDRRRL